MNFINRVKKQYSITAGDLIHVPFGAREKEWEQFKNWAKEEYLSPKDLGIADKQELERTLKEYKKKKMGVKELFDDRLHTITDSPGAEN